MTGPDSEMNALVRAWRSAPDRPVAPERLRRHVRRRRLQILAWVVAEAVIGVAGIAVLAAVAVASASPIVRGALGLLAAVSAAYLAFTWFNWRGSLAAVGESTAAFLDLSRTRLLRIRRAIRFGWGLLAAEGVLLGVFVWERTRGADAPAWPWAFLVVMVASAALGLVWAQRWVAREADVLDDFTRE